MRNVSFLILLSSTILMAQAPKREIAVPSVMVTAPLKQKIADQFVFSGNLIAKEEVLVSAEIEGLRIVNLLAEEGDRVKKGQVLLRLNDEQLLISLQQVEASRAKAKAGIEQAKNNIILSEAAYEEAKLQFDRAKALLEKKDIAPAVYDQRNAAYKSALARVNSAKDGLQLAQADVALIEAQTNDVKLRLSRTEVRAPLDGLISRRTAKIGQTASMASPEPLFRIIVKGLVELEGDVLETRLNSLKAGQKVLVGDGIKGEIRLVPTEVNPLTRLGKVRVALPEEASLKIGGFARALVTIDQREGLTLPVSAISTLDNGEIEVQTIENNRVTSKKVKTGIKAEGRVEIKEGLTDKDSVIVRAGPFLRNGDQVKPVLEAK